MSSINNNEAFPTVYAAVWRDDVEKALYVRESKDAGMYYSCNVNGVFRNTDGIIDAGDIHVGTAIKEVPVIGIDNYTAGICDTCGNLGAFWTIDPYDADVNDIEVDVFICNNCYQDRSDAI